MSGGGEAAERDEWKKKFKNKNIIYDIIKKSVNTQYF